MFNYNNMFIEILKRLPNKKKNFNNKDKENYSFKCTNHDDKHESAYIALTSDWDIVVGCRTCGSEYGLNTLLVDLGLNKSDFIEKNAFYDIKEDLKKYIIEKNIGNVYKNESTGEWIVDENYKFDDAYFYTDDRGTIVSVKIKYKLINKSENLKSKKFVQRVIRENRIIPASIETVDKLQTQYIYNVLAVQNALKQGEYIYLVEGEKDADTLINNGLVATSFANGAGSMYKDYKTQLKGAKLVICGDFDEAGRKHINKVREYLKDVVEKMYIVEYLPELSKVPNTKVDVTDWLNSGHTVKEFTNYVFNSCLDVLNNSELQEIKDDLNYGIFKITVKNGVEKRTNICNFTIVGINIINRVDNEEEYFEITIRTKNQQIIRRHGSVLVFNDVRKFRDFLNSSDLVYRGNIDILNDLKEWCFKYKKRETTIAYDTAGIRKIDGEWLYVTSDGSFNSDFVYDKSKVYYEDDRFCSFQNIELPTKDEIDLIFESLTNFNKKEVVYTVLGQIGAMLLNAKLMYLGFKLNNFAIFGESGSGKSTTVENIIMPLMNYEVKNNIKDVTNFAFIKETSKNTTLPFIVDEYKPSTFLPKKNQEISNLFRNIYDRNSSVRGNKLLKTIEIKPIRPLVIIGEEGFWQDETALIERTNIVYISRATRLEGSIKHIENLSKNKNILNKLGKLLVSIALLMEESFLKKQREEINSTVCFKDRVLNTYTNTVQGLNIFRIAFKYYNIELDFKEGIKYIKKNIEENVLQNSKETKTQVEKMLVIIDEMLSNEIDLIDGIRVDKEDKVLYLYMPVIYPAIKKYIRDYNLDENVLSKNDFIKQLKDSKYLLDKTVFLIQINKKPRKAYRLDLNKLEELGLDNICLLNQ